MTAVVGFYWTQEVVMIADTRVSWPDGTHRPIDGLQKLYRIAGQNAALGFCSDNLRGAKTVVSHLRNHRYQNLETLLKEGFRQGVETKTMLSPAIGKGLKFMLCGINPAHSPAAQPNKQGLPVLRNPNAYIRIYEVDEHSGEVILNLVTPQKKGVAVIGSATELEEDIRSTVYNWMGLAFTHPQHRQSLADMPRLVIQHMFGHSGSVGGPYQVLYITPNGIDTDYKWRPDESPESAEWHMDGETVIVSNPAVGKTYYLHPIWDTNF